MCRRLLQLPRYMILECSRQRKEKTSWSLSLTEQTGMLRERAVEILLHTYVTGDSTEVEAIFGSAAWARVVDASRDLKNVRKAAKRFLGQQGPKRVASRR